MVDKKTTAAVVLAAGQGTRMKSRVPKVLHKIAGQSIIQIVKSSIRQAGIDHVCLVVGHQGEVIRQEVDDVAFVVQKQQLGTGHAVVQAEGWAADYDSLLVTCGDAPLFQAGTFADAVARHHESGAAATVVSVVVDDPTGYGRLLRDSSGEISRVIEHKDASPEQREIREINTGVYVFDVALCFPYLNRIRPNNTAGEYYLPDLVQVLREDGQKVTSFCISDPSECFGINDRVQLAEAEAIMQDRIRHRWMVAGVTMLDPKSVYIDADCAIGQDTILYPNVRIASGTTIGQACTIKSNVELMQAQIGDNVTISNAILDQAAVGDGSSVGPFAYLRPGTKVGCGCKIGDFVELKNSRIDDTSKVPHHSYIGDAEIGAGVNIGCGTITCNYDGQNKSRTVIGDGAFIGSNTNLVAPVRVGDGAYIAAGSTINQDVPPEMLAIARARQENKIWRKKGLTKKHNQ